MFETRATVCNVHLRLRSRRQLRLQSVPESEAEDEQDKGAPRAGQLARRGVLQNFDKINVVFAITTDNGHSGTACVSKERESPASRLALRPSPAIARVCVPHDVAVAHDVGLQLRRPAQRQAQTHTELHHQRER